MSQAWLSYDRAPPIWLPTGFFVAALCWLLPAAGLLLGAGPAVADRFLPLNVALTHVLALGVLGNIMIGALLQLLAVLAAVPVAHPGGLMARIGLPWQLGVALLVRGFVTGFDPLSLQWAAVALSVAVVCLLAHAAIGLWRSPARDASSRGMAVAVAGLCVAVCFGVALVMTLSGRYMLPFMPLLNSHVLWASIGWVLALLLAISQTVVPMFMITPAYPVSTRWLGRAVLPLLCVATLQQFGVLPAGAAPAWALWALAAGYAVMTLRLLGQSRRKADPARRQWRLAMVYLLAASLAAMASLYQPQSTVLPLVAGLLWLGGLGLCVMLAMLGKIVPFLAWLHLKHLNPPRGILPSTHGFLSEAAQSRLGLSHAVWLACGVAWCLRPAALHLPFALASGWLALHGAVLGGRLAWRYRRIRASVLAAR